MYYSLFTWGLCRHKFILIMKRYLNSIEKMRKYLMAIAAVICCTMAASMLTACGSDDDDSSSSNGPATTEEKKATTAVVDLSISQTEDFLQYFDMTITCSDGTPSKMTSTKWTKQVTVTLPGTITLTGTAKNKTGEDLSNNTSTINVYSFKGGCSCEYTLKDATGANIKTNIVEKLGQPRKSKLSLVATYAENPSSNLNNTLTLTFDAEGNCTPTYQYTSTSTTN